VKSKATLALIGCGAVARKGHLPGLKKLSKIVRVKWVVDINVKRAKSVARRFKVEKWAKSYDIVLKDPEVDIVVIATPTPTHARIAKECIESGKNVIIEKPLTLTVAEALELRELTKKNNVACGVVFNYRYFKAVLQAKRSIMCGNLGEVFFLNSLSETEFPTAWTRSRWLYHRGGVLYDYLPHMIDLACWLLDKVPSHVYAITKSHTEGEFIDQVSILMSLEDKVNAFFEASWLTGSYVSSIQIHGTGGIGVIDIKYNTYAEHYGGPTPVGLTKDLTSKLINTFKGVMTGEIFLGAMSLYYDFYLDNISKFLRHGEFSITLEDGLINVAILEAALKSGETGKEIYIRELLEA